MTRKRTLAAAISGIAVALSISIAIPASAAVAAQAGPTIVADELGDSAYAVSADEIQVTAPGGDEIVAPMTRGYVDIGGWAEYKVGVLATRVGAVPVGYIHYSWSTMWKIKLDGME